MQRNQRRHAHYVTLTPKVKEGFLQLRPHMAIGYFYGLLVCFIHKITRKFPDIFSYFCCFSSKGDVSVFLSVLRWEADKYQYWNMEKDEGKFIFMTMHFLTQNIYHYYPMPAPPLYRGNRKFVLEFHMSTNCSPEPILPKVSHIPLYLVGEYMQTL